MQQRHDPDEIEMTDQSTDEPRRRENRPTGILPTLSQAVTPSGTAAAPTPPRTRPSDEDAPTLDFRTGIASLGGSLSPAFDKRGDELAAERDGDERRTDPWSIRREETGEPELDPGELVGGRYQILELLGEGGMARTYRVRHVSLGKQFALKALHASVASDPRMRDFFFREAQIAGQLDHPNIVGLTDYGVDEELGSFLVMELLEGATLHERTQGQPPLRLTLALDYALQIAEALQYMHRMGIIHRDVKPDNIFVCHSRKQFRRRPVLKLIDFGLARRETLGAQLSKQELLGTPIYMAPEQLLRAPPQPAMDIYALGTLLYELITGAPPFTGSVDAIVQAKTEAMPEPPSANGMEIPSARVDALLMKALAKDPSNRHPSMAHFIFELRTLMDMLGLQPPPQAQQSSQLALSSTSAVEQGWLAFEASPFPQFTLCPDTTLLAANQAFAWFMGRPIEALRGLPMRETRLRHVYPDLEADLEAAAAQSAPLERQLKLELKDGASSRLTLWLTPLVDAGGRVVSCTGVIVPR